MEDKAQDGVFKVADLSFVVSKDQMEVNACGNNTAPKMQLAFEQDESARAKQLSQLKVKMLQAIIDLETKTK